MKKRLKGLAAFACAAVGVVFVSGCPGNGGGGGIASGVLRGEVSLAVSHLGASTLNTQAVGIFFKGIDVSGTFTAPPLDACYTPAPTATTSPTPGPTPAPLDVGATISLANGGTTLTLTGSNFGGVEYYQPTATLPSPIPLGVAWDYANAGGVDVPAGSITGAIHMPQMIVLANTNMNLTSSSTVTWTPAGSQYVTLTFLDSTANTVLTCVANDDGSFDIPATLPAGTGSGSISALNENTYPMAGGVSWFLGITEATFTWTK